MYVCVVLVKSFKREKRRTVPILKDHSQLESSASQSAKIHKRSARSGRLLHFESTKPLNLQTFTRLSWSFMAFVRDFLYLFVTCQGWAAGRIRGRPCRRCIGCGRDLWKAFCRRHIDASAAGKTLIQNKDSKVITERTDQI